MRARKACDTLDQEASHARTVRARKLWKAKALITASVLKGNKPILRNYQLFKPVVVQNVPNLSQIPRQA